jgi:hypothetical protein
MKYKDDVERKLLLRSTDREFRVDGALPVNPTGEFLLRLENGVQGRYEVKWVKIPNSVYNVNETNNVFTFSTRFGGPNVVTVDPQNYTGSELATKLTSILVAYDPDLIVTYDSQKLRLVFASSANGVSAYNYITIFTGGQNSINRVIGFPQFEQKFSLGSLNPIEVSFVKPTTAAVSNFAPYAIQLSNPLSIGLAVREATSNNFKTAQQAVAVSNGQPVYTTKSVAAALIVPLIVEKGSYAFLSSDVLRQYLNFGRTVKTLTVKVVDLKTGQKLDLNNVDWEMYLQRVD